MDDNDVMNNTVPTSDPIQPDVDPDLQGPTVIEQDTGTMYKNAKAGQSSPVVAENNHAESIANNTLNHPQSEKTFGYTSQAQKDYDTTVDTTTVQSTGANMSATWDSEMKMDKNYTVNDQEDYSWNKLAEEMAKLDYAQESNQARYESMQTKQEIDKAATTAFNNYFAAEYSARQTQDKMGWTGGQQTASDLQVAFLQAETAADMYTQDEMQRYGVETKLGIARMYAEANQRALALDYYQDAVDQAIKEAEQTGWYIPAEAGEMFKQDEMARKVLADPTATQAEKDRANNVLKNTQAYYDNKGFQTGYAYDENGNVVTEYYGIKCLQMLQYEETVRNNKVNEELQREANQIADKAANAAWSSAGAAWAGVELGWVEQNWREGQAAVTQGKQVTPSSNKNWYKDNDGNSHYISTTAKMYKYNGRFFYQDSKGDVYPVYNSDKAHATSYAKDHGTESNYRAFGS